MVTSFLDSLAVLVTMIVIAVLGYLGIIGLMDFFRDGAGFLQVILSGGALLVALALTVFLVTKFAGEAGSWIWNILIYPFSRWRI